MKCQQTDSPAGHLRMSAGRLALAVAVVLAAVMVFSVCTAEQSDASAASWDSGNCTVSLADDGILTVAAVSGTDGAMADYASASDVPWAASILSVQKIAIGDGVTHLGNYTFAGASNLRSLSAPSSAGAADSTVFDGLTFQTPRCTRVSADSLAGHEFSGFGDKVMYQTTGDTGDCSWSYDITTKTLTISGDGRMADYSLLSRTPWGEGVVHIVIEEGVTSIGNGAFEYCGSVSSVDIPRSVTSIGNSAFLDCRGLSGVDGCYSLVTIGEAAFASCTSLKYLDLPYTVTTIGNDAFAGCTMLTEFTVPSSVTVLEEELFFGCTGLTFVTLSEGLTAIGLRAFCDCSSMVLFEIPSTVTSIDIAAFKNCTSLQSISIPASVTAIGASAFEGCSALRSAAFANNGDLEVIDDCAFLNCTALAAADIPSSVREIGRGAFAYRSSLTRVTIPSAVGDIDELAFAGITFKLPNGTEVAVSAANLAGHAFSGTDGKVLYMTSGSTGGCSWTYDLPAGVLEISGNGAMGDYTSASPAPWGKDVRSISIGRGVTAIGDCAFLGCSNVWDITIPSSVKSVGEKAFSGCTSLSYIDIPSSVQSVGGSAFGDMKFMVNGTEVSADAANLAGHVFRMGTDGAMECGSHSGQTDADSGSSFLLALYIFVIVIVAGCVMVLAVKRF